VREHTDTQAPVKKASQTDNLIVYKERLARAESFIEHSEGAIEEYTRKLNDAKDCGHDASVECPSCKHSWVPGKTPADIHKLETLLNEIREKRKKALEVKESLTEDVKKQMDFANGLRYLTNFVQEHPLFRNFWEQIYSEKVHTKEPETLMNRALRYKEDLEACKQLAALRELVENNNRKIESLKALDQLSLAKFDMSLPGMKNPIHAETKHNDLTAVIVDLREAVERQIKKYKHAD
jgi:ribosome-associated translation inhibitor RaiA